MIAFFQKIFKVLYYWEKYCLANKFILILGKTSSCLVDTVYGHLWSKFNKSLRSYVRTLSLKSYKKFSLMDTSNSRDILRLYNSSNFQTWVLRNLGSGIRATRPDFFSPNRAGPICFQPNLFHLKKC